MQKQQPDMYGGNQQAIRKQNPLQEIAAQNGGNIPLFHTLHQMGISRPEEQKLFFEYAQGSGHMDPQSGDFIIPQNRAMALWQNMKTDQNFINAFDATRVQGIEQQMPKIKQMLMQPEVRAQLEANPQAKQYYGGVIQQMMREHDVLKKRLMEQSQQNVNQQMGQYQPPPQMAQPQPVQPEKNHWQEVLRQVPGSINPKNRNNDWL